MAQVERRVENGKAAKREVAKQKRSRRAEQNGEVDWSELDWSALTALLIEIVDAGGALRIGRTRDGGAWAIGVYLDNDYATEYIQSKEVFSEALGEIAAAWLSDGGEGYTNRVVEARYNASAPPR